MPCAGALGRQTLAPCAAAARTRTYACSCIDRQKRLQTKGKRASDTWMREGGAGGGAHWGLGEFGWPCRGSCSLARRTRRTGSDTSRRSAVLPAMQARTAHSRHKCLVCRLSHTHSIQGSDPLMREVRQDVLVLFRTTSRRVPSMRIRVS